MYLKLDLLKSAQRTGSKSVDIKEFVVAELSFLIVMFFVVPENRTCLTDVIYVQETQIQLLMYFCYSTRTKTYLIVTDFNFM